MPRAINSQRRARAEIVFTVARVQEPLRDADPPEGRGTLATAHLAAALECVTAEVLRLTRDPKTLSNDYARMVHLRHVLLTAHLDKRLQKLLKKLPITQGGSFVLHIKDKNPQNQES